MKKRTLLGALLVLLCGTKASADDLVISSATDWESFTSKAATYANGNITLGADITVTTPYAGSFAGTFDGQGHTLTLAYDDLTAATALFQATTDGAVFRNLKVTGEVAASKAFGGLILNNNGATTLEDVHISGNFATTDGYLSGFVVYSTARLAATRCSFHGTLAHKGGNIEANAAAFISRNNSTSSYSFHQCESAADITVTTGWRAGGFVGSDYITAVAECEFVDCIYSGSLDQNNGSDRIAALVGNTDNEATGVVYSIKNCLLTGTVKKKNGANAARLGYGVNSKNVVLVSNLYHTASTGFTGNNQESKIVSDEEAASGKLCYQLNGDQTTTNFRQTLGEDAVPVLDATHAVVYQAGRKHCDGTDYDDVAYNNVGSDIQIDDHSYADGACSVCGKLEVAEDGFYHIANMEQLKRFIAAVNGGNVTTNACLEQNILLEEWADGANPMIGTSEHPYAGTFDGQGHKFLLNYTPTKAAAIFAATGEGAVIRNLIVSGSVTSDYALSGLIMDVEGATCIENVQMKAELVSATDLVAGYVANCKARLTVRNSKFSGTVESTKAGEAHAAGFIGASRTTGSYSFNQCESAGNILVAGWRAGGFVGSDFISKVAECEYIDCIFSGDINQTNDSKRIGAFTGSIDNNPGTYTFKNCLVSGQMKRWNNATDKQMIINAEYLLYCDYNKSATINVDNVYHTPSAGYTETAKQGSQLVAEEDVASGKLCYMLNGDQSTTNFRQTLGEDVAPVLDPTHAIVYVAGHKHCDGSDYEGISYNNEGGTTVTDDHDFDNNVCTFCGELLMSEDGYFHAIDAATFTAFAKAVSLKGKATTNVKLDADITIDAMGTGADCPMIGTPDYPYAGVFDGQNHTFTATVTANEKEIGGVFQQMAGATIMNVVFEGSVNAVGQAGLVGQTSGGDPVFQNIINKMDIRGTKNVGGFIGNSNNTGKNCTFKNVMFAGKVTYANTKSGDGIGGFVGWSYSTKFTTEGCAMIGEIDLGPGTTPAYLLRIRSTASVNAKDCAYKKLDNVKYVNGNNDEHKESTVPVGFEETTSGAMCYALNGDQSTIAWYQTLGEDEAPVLDPSHKVVYAQGEGYTNALPVAIDGVAADKTDGAIYNLAGQRISRLQKGVNIVAGKKVLR